MPSNPNALLLGRPKHQVPWYAPGAPDELTIVVEHIPEKRAATGYGGIGVSPERKVTVTYKKYPLGSGPANALVYVSEDYEPQQEDIELVLSMFGDEAPGDAMADFVPLYD